MPLPINSDWASWNVPNASGPPQGAWNKFMQRLCSGIYQTAAQHDPPGLLEESERHTAEFREGLSGLDAARHELQLAHAKQEKMARMHELAIQGAYATSEEEIAVIDAEFTRILVKYFSP